MFRLIVFQNNASKLLLAIMESRHDSENAERILYNMRPKELVNVKYSLTLSASVFGIIIFNTFTIFTCPSMHVCFHLH